MFSQVAVSTERHEIRERINPLLAPFDLVMDLEVRSAQGALKHLLCPVQDFVR